MIEYVVGAVCAGAILWLPVVVFWPLSRRRRRAFVLNREMMADDVFLSGLAITVPQEQAVAVAIRRAIGRELRLTSELLHGPERLRDLDNLQLFAPNLLEAARVGMRQAVGMEMDGMFVWEETGEGRGPLDRETVAEFIRFYLENQAHWVSCHSRGQI